eukprot:scaffold764_cov408-Prasinococcus_capsulatus_cf.AAC.17
MPRSNLPTNRLKAAVKNGVVAPIVWSNDTGMYDTAAIEETIEMPWAALKAKSDSPCFLLLML